jgi:hypothetical protein
MYAEESDCLLPVGPSLCAAIKEQRTESALPVNFKL